MRQFFLFISISILTGQALACSQSRQDAWNSAVQNETLPQATTVASIQTRYQVQVQPFLASGNCQVLKINDSDGSFLGEIPMIGRPDYDAAELERRVKHMLLTDRATLRRLGSALEAYVDDTIASSERYNFGTTSRSDFAPLSGEGIRVDLTADTCSNNGTNFSGPNPLNTSVTINHIEYRPDVTTYDAHRIYQAGQFQQAVLQNPQTVAALVNHTSDNLISLNALNRPDGSTYSPCRSMVTQADAFLRDANPEALNSAIIARGQSGSTQAAEQ